MDYRQFLKDHGVMPWQYPITPSPDYVWDIHVAGQKFAGRFESPEIARAFIDHHNDTTAWAKANLPKNDYEFITTFQLIEVPRPRVISAEEMFANIQHVLTVMELQGELGELGQ